LKDPLFRLMGLFP